MRTRCFVHPLSPATLVGMYGLPGVDLEVYRDHLFREVVITLGSFVVGLAPSRSKKPGPLGSLALWRSERRGCAWPGDCASPNTTRGSPIRRPTARRPTSCSSAPARTSRTPCPRRDRSRGKLASRPTAPSNAPCTPDGRRCSVPDLRAPARGPRARRDRVRATPLEADLLDTGDDRRSRRPPGRVRPPTPPLVENSNRRHRMSPLPAEHSTGAATPL